MKVLLITNVDGVGKAGEVKKVAAGYARNYLLPKNLVVRATPGAIRMADTYRNKASIKAAEQEVWIRELVEKLSKFKCTLSANADEKGHLFGGISEKEIFKALQEAGIEIDRKHILLDEHIKSLGEFQVPIRVSGDITENITVEIISE